jgi:hypothetical protein
MGLGRMEKLLPLPEIVLRQAVIRPGDVLLTCGAAFDSKAISRLSSGPFSHAALCINRFMTFESDGDVIGHRRICFLGSDTEGVHLGQIPGAVTHAGLYRHPLMEAISEEAFAKLLAAEIDDSYGKDYSELYRLVPLSNLPEAIQPMMEWTD